MQINVVGDLLREKYLDKAEEGEIQTDGSQSQEQSGSRRKAKSASR